jgi:hypothetical protein
MVFGYSPIHYISHPMEEFNYITNFIKIQIYLINKQINFNKKGFDGTIKTI